MLPPQCKAQGNGCRVQTNYKCQEWKTCQLIVSPSILKTGGTQLHAVRGGKSEYTRTKHLLGKGNTQTHHKGSYIYTIFGPIVNGYKEVKSQDKVF